MHALKKGGVLVSILAYADEAALKAKGVQTRYVFVAPNGAQLETLAKWADEGKLRVPLAAVLPLAEAAKAPQSIHEAYNNLANILLQLGRLDKASDALAQARAADERYGYTPGLRWLEGEHMQERHLRGDWNDALTLADQIIAAAARSPRYHEAPARMIRSEILLSRGEVEPALVESERALAIALESGDEQVVVPALAFRARALAAAGREGEADEVLADLLASHDPAYAWMHELPPLVNAVRGSAVDLHHTLLPVNVYFTFHGGVTGGR